MFLVYIDESGSFNDSSYAGTKWSPQSRRESSHFVLTCVIVEKSNWKKSFNRFKKLRQSIKSSYNIPISEFLHANELIAGKDRWKHSSRRSFDRPKRITLLKTLLHEYGQWNELQTMSVVVDKTTSIDSINPSTCRHLAYENLLNRVEKNLVDENYVVVHDGQEDLSIIRIIRKLQAVSTIKTLSLIIEDPLFKRGLNSYFLQMTDHIAYSTLHLFDQRFNVEVGEAITRSGIYSSIGVSRACHATSETMPGVIPVPTPKKLN